MRANRTELMMLLHERHPSAAVRNAALLGTTVLFGGFSEIPPRGLPGWIFRIRSPHGQVDKLVGLTIDEATRKYGFVSLEKVPWSKWDGDPNRTPPTIYDGDDPARYALKKLSGEDDDPRR